MQMITTLLLAAAALGVMRIRPALRGTTLVAPWAWAIFAIGCLSMACWITDSTSAVGVTSALRHIAATSTICPAMAVLGAKRPQDRGWAFIVLSLWGILALPAMQAMAFAPASPLELHAAWQIFLLLLALTGNANWAATRFFPSALLVSIAQWCWLRGTNALPMQVSSQMIDLVAACCLMVAVALGRYAPRPHDTSAGWDRVWHDFRDAFGVVWALRVSERINQSADRYQWPLRLQWSGFQKLAETPAADWNRDEFEQSVRTLLRRFVSNEWIDRKQGPNDVWLRES